MLSENQRITSATIIGTTITVRHQLSNLSPMTESDTLSVSSGDMKTNQKIDTDLNSGSGTSKGASEESETFRDLPVTRWLENGKEFWKCNHCQRKYLGWNITKVLQHLARKDKTSNICHCEFTSSPVTKELIEGKYNQVLQKGLRKRKIVAITDHYQKQHVDANLKTGLIIHSNTKLHRSSQSISVSSLDDGTRATVSSDCSSVRTNISESHERPIRKKQLTFAHKKTTMDEMEGARVAIADFIHGCGLPFSLSEHPKFRSMCTAMMEMTNRFKFPNRRSVAGKYLDKNYQVHQDKYKKELLDHAETFGLMLLGDGATVKRMPLMNIIASGVYCPVAVLAIADCTKQMADGKTKNAEFVVKHLFVPHFATLDPEKKLIDMVAFDGASNVQKAGRALCDLYPRCTVIHGGEHVVSLVCGDICKLPVIYALINVNKALYRFFMLHHMPHSMFGVESRRRNSGVAVMMIRASDTRMGGHFISLARTYRLKEVFESVISQAKFQDLNIGSPLMKSKIVKLVQSKRFWDHLLVCLRSVFSLLKILRLCDKKKPAMDRLFYYVYHTDKSLAQSCTHFNDMEKEVARKDSSLKDEYYRFPSIMQKKKKNQVVDIESDDDESDDYKTEYAESGNEYESDSEEEEEADGKNITESAESLGSSVLQCWNKRRHLLLHNFAIAAWILSPIPEIMKHARDIMKNAEDNLRYRVQVDDLIDRLFHGEDTGKVKDTFWQEWDDFSDKRGVAYDRDFIWNGTNIENGETYKWHKLYTLHTTKVLGKFACRVTSKILGIGSAERSWGDVKHIKNSKRSHISASRIEKSATIFGASCAQKAAIQQKLKEEDGTYKSNLFFDDEDLAISLKIEHQDVIKALPCARPFNAWVEDWELTKKKN